MKTRPTKGTDFSVHSQAHLNKVARELNERPRKTLEFEIQQNDLTLVLHRPVEPARLHFLVDLVGESRGSG